MNGEEEKAFSASKIMTSDAEMLYYIFGSGSKILLAFHGYGQSAAVFRNLAEALPQYRIYSFDLFFHGKSIWKSDGNILRPEIWRQLLQNFLQKEQISEFSLLGFSLGGKVVLATYTMYISQVKNIYLLAPDGVSLSPWYVAATQLSFGRKFFHFLIKKTKFSTLMINILEKTGILHKKIGRFVKREMATENQRYRVYQTWLLYRGLNSNIKYVVQKLKACNQPIEIYIGKYDQVIRKKHIRPLLKEGILYNFQVLSSGHTHLIEAFCSFKRGQTFPNSKLSGEN
ncbi:MAG: alpha/beta hydrolase [Cyclobacteriaceae bacterium]|nr:alpha/beta hydrolase [Cyclobacteriaceae bacterium]